jgi:hypothetical protein
MKTTAQMDKVESTRVQTIEKINCSINECHTLEQLSSIEQFLNRYYRSFSFDPKYFRQEWTLDTQIRKRKLHLSTLIIEESTDSIFGSELMSLNRLSMYIKSNSIVKLREDWVELRSQLIGIDISAYPAMNEKIAYLKNPSRYENQFIREVQDMVYKTWHKLSII